MKKKTVTIATGEVQLDIVRSSRRTVALYVKPGGTLLLRAPWYVPVYVLMQFVRQKTDWIERQIPRLKDVKPVGDRPLIDEGSVIPFLGTLLTVHVSEGPRNTARLIDNVLHITVAGDRSPLKITPVVERWYLNQAKTLFSLRTGELASLHAGLLPAPGAVNVRRMKRRWGTCHSSGAIWLNSELVKKDPELIDYVIIHEVCHLVHHNHSKEYYGLLGTIIPNYRELRKRLQN